jgi:hypothetical protein
VSEGPSAQIGALSDFGRELERAIAADAPSAPVHHPRRAWAVAGLILLVAGALTGLAFTPPGRAVAGEIGRLVGIGEPATLPARHFPNLTERGQPIVIASGRAPDGSPYEVVATRSVAHTSGGTAAGPAGEVSAAPQPGEDSGEVETCLTADLPETPQARGVEFCVGQGDKGFIDQGNVLDGTNFIDRMGEQVGDTASVGPQARYELTAELSPNITRVDVSYEDKAGNRVKAYSDVGAVNDEIGTKIGTEDRLGYMIAFLPDDGLPPAWSGNGLRRDAGVLGTVELVGYDASGTEVARDNFGERMTREYDANAKREDTQARLSAEVRRREQGGTLELDKSNVELCSHALSSGVRTPSCEDVIHRAAEQGLYGWHAGGGGDVSHP